MRRMTMTFVCAALFLVLAAQSGRGLPVISTEGKEVPFVVRHQSVHVEVYNHLIRTTITQVIYNDGDKQVPCYFDLHLPKGAHASMLEAEVDGKKFVGRIVTKQAARKIVEQSRKEEKAAALAEERNGVLHVELSQVKAHQEFVFRVAYIEEAEYRDGAFHYWFGIKKFNSEMPKPETYTFDISFRCTADVLSVEAERQTLVGAIEGGKGDFAIEDVYGAREDVHIIYTLDLKPGEPHIMIKNDGKEDPYFCLLSLPPEAEAPKGGRSLVLILDKSGSMNDAGKFGLACSALVDFIDHLRPEDRFNLFIFDNTYYACSPLPFLGDEKGKKEAKAFIKKFRAQGGTYILGPTLDALKQLDLDREHPTAVVLLTDGEGSTEARKFIKKVDEACRFRVPLYVFAIGEYVNLPLLRSLGRYSGGAFTQIVKEGDIKKAVEHIRMRFDKLIGFSLDLTTEGKVGYQRYPQRMSLLYGAELLKVYGRLKGGEPVKMLLSAKTGSGKWVKEIVADTSVPRQDCPFLDQAWGIRRLQALMDDDAIFGGDEARRKEMIALSKRYLVTTPYTSFVFSELDEKVQQAIEEEEDEVFEDKGSYGGAKALRRRGKGQGHAAGGAAPAGRPRGSNKKYDADALKEKAKKEGKPAPPPLAFTADNDLVNSAGKPLPDQILAHALAVWGAARLSKPSKFWSDIAAKSLTWLAVHVQDGSISDDPLEQMVTLCALATAADKDEAVKKIAAAVFAKITERKDWTRLEGKTDDYAFMWMFFAARAHEAGYVLPAEAKKSLEAEFVKRAAVDLAKLPFGAEVSTIRRWVEMYPIALAVAPAVEVKTAGLDEPGVSLAAFAADQRAPLSRPDFAYWLAVSHLKRTGVKMNASKLARARNVERLHTAPDKAGGVFKGGWEGVLPLYFDLLIRM